MVQEFHPPTQRPVEVNALNTLSCDVELIEKIVASPLELEREERPIDEYLAIRIESLNMQERGLEVPFGDFAATIDVDVIVRYVVIHYSAE